MALQPIHGIPQRRAAVLARSSVISPPSAPSESFSASIADSITFGDSVTTETIGLGKALSDSITLSESISSVGGITGLTSYLTSTNDTLVTTARQLTNTAPSSETNVSSAQYGKSATGWTELFSQGSSSALAGTEPSPSGNGFLWDVTTLEGQQIVAGTWTPTLTLSCVGGSFIADIHGRAFVRSSAGVFTQITAGGVATDMVLSAQTIGTTRTSYSFAGTALDATSFGTGDKLYLDVVLNVTTGDSNNTAANRVIRLYENGGAAEGVVTPGFKVGVSAFTANITDSITFGDSVTTETIGLGKALFDSITFAESLTRVVAESTRPLSDSITLSESIARTSAHPRAVSDSVTLTESLPATLALQVPAGQSTITATLKQYLGAFQAAGSSTTAGQPTVPGPAIIPLAVPAGQSTASGVVSAKQPITLQAVAGQSAVAGELKQYLGAFAAAGQSGVSTTVAVKQPITLQIPAGAATVSLALTAPIPPVNLPLATAAGSSTVSLLLTPLARQTGFPVNNSGSGRTTQAITTVAVGDTLLVGVRILGGDITVTGVTGGGATGWHAVTDHADAADSRYIAVWAGTVNATGSQTVTVTYSSAPAVNCEIVVDELAGVTALGTGGATDYAGATGTTVTFPALTPGAGDGYWGYARSSVGGNAGTVTAGYTAIVTSQGDMVVFNPQVAGVQAPTYSTGGASNWDAIGVLIRTATVAAPIPCNPSAGQSGTTLTLTSGIGAPPAPRCFLPTPFVSSGSTITPALTGWTNAGQGYTGTAPQTGDLVALITAAAGTTNTFTQTAGTGDWTSFGPDNNGTSPGSLVSAVAMRIFDGTETTPTFVWSGTPRTSWSLVAIAPGPGHELALDTLGPGKRDSTAATTHTPPAASAASANEVSLILTGLMMTTAATTQIAVTAPSGWTGLTTGVNNGGGVSRSYAANIAFQTAVAAGPVTPGPETVNVSTAANLYHALVRQAAVTPLSLPGLAHTRGQGDPLAFAPQAAVNVRGRNVGDPSVGATVTTVRVSPPGLDHTLGVAQRTLGLPAILTPSGQRHRSLGTPATTLAPNWVRLRGIGAPGLSGPIISLAHTRGQGSISVAVTLKTARPASIAHARAIGVAPRLSRLSPAGLNHLTRSLGAPFGISNPRPISLVHTRGESPIVVYGPDALWPVRRLGTPFVYVVQRSVPPSLTHTRHQGTTGIRGRLVITTLPVSHTRTLGTPVTHGRLMPQGQEHDRGFSTPSVNVRHLTAPALARA